jgi:cystathionine beta-lyase
MPAFDRVPNRRNSARINKWTTYPNDVLPMWIADMDLPTAPQIIAALQKQIAQGVLGYEFPSMAFYQIIAARMYKLYGWEVNPESIVYTAGVNNGYNIAARLLCTSERGYIIQSPVYNEFHDTQAKIGAPELNAPLAKTINGNKISYEVDFDALKKAVRNAGMFLLCHPHNPVGHIYTRGELKRMAEICIENKVTIVSDEIHSELLLGDAKFIPMAVISPETERNTITLISASKTFNIPGLSCAFAIIPDNELRAQFYAIGYGMSFEFSTPGLTAAQVAFSGKADPWLKCLRNYLTGNRDFLVDYVSRHMPDAKFTVPDATFLAWLDFSAYKLKESPFDFFLERAKVGLSDGKLFGKGSEGFVRVHVGTSRSLLERGFERMRKALHSL